MSNKLTPADLEMFKRIGVGAELLEMAGVYRVTDAEARENFGISRQGDMSGIAFPYFDPLTDDRVTARIRRDHPDMDVEGKTENKYISPYGDNPHLYFPRGSGAMLDDVTAPVVLIEAEKSALAITALAMRTGRNLLTIATGGCWGWRGRTGIEAGPSGERQEVHGPVPDLGRIRLDGRKAVIVADSNVATNPNVAAARQALAAELSKRDAEVYLAHLPQEPGINGPDDFIAVHGGEALLSLIDNAGEWRPSITLKAGEYPRAVDEAEEILCASAERLRIFQRAGEVVRVITLPDSKRGGGLRREPGTVQLVPVGSVALTEVWDRLIEWQKLKATKGVFERARIDCPGRIAAAYLSRIGAWRLPHLAGIISAPIMRLDGTIHCRGGYDATTGLLLTEDWPDLDGNPTRGDALAALRELEGPFSEFPFVGPEDRSVLIAAIETAIQRRLLSSAPLFGFKAPTTRTGKSLSAECVAIVATGLPVPAMGVSGDREEIRKAVTTALREGHMIVNLDNIELPLGSPDLSRAITQAEYSDRLLGENRMLRLPTNVLWTATGNNLAFRGDLAVRTLLCSLDARMERPEERHFKIPDLKQYVTDHRRELVTAAITILRAYVVAGRPDQGLKPWGGFDQWSATIRAALVWLGMADPCETRQHVIEDDPDREHAAALLYAWHAAFGAEPVLVAQVVERVAADSDLRNTVLAVAAAKDDAKQPDPRKLGWWCRNWRHCPVGGLVLDQGKPHGNAATWKVGRGPDRGVTGVSGVRSPSKNVDTTQADGDSGQADGHAEVFRADDDSNNSNNSKPEPSHQPEAEWKPDGEPSRLFAEDEGEVRL
jgi:hypothetical protein